MHKPVDEREQSLFGTAYKQSLSVLWLGLVIVLIWGRMSPIIGGVLLIASYLAGWFALRHEELSYAEQGSIHAVPSLKTFWALLIGISGILLLITALHPQGYVVYGIIMIVSYYLVLITWSWKATSMFSTHARVFLAIVIPFIGIPLGMHQVQSVGRKMVSTVSFAFRALILPVLVVIIVRLYIVFPVFIATDAFQPALEEGSYVLVDKIVRVYAPGDYVIIKENADLVVGQITSLDSENIVVTTSSGQKIVERKYMQGRVILP